MRCIVKHLADGVFMKPGIGPLIFMTSLLALAAPAARAQGPHKTLVAVFAHPDDERMAGPILARYAREGHRVHLIVATDGSKGVTKHAGIPAGDSLVAIRKAETECAVRELGIEPPIFLGLDDGGLASFAALARLRSELKRVLAELRPDALITFGPEGGTGHPDHRLVGVAVTEVVQRGGAGIPDALFYPALPAERMSDAPKASPQMNSVAMKHLNVRVAFEERDFEAAHREYACHASQYTREQVDMNMRYMRHAFGGFVYLRRWNDTQARSELF
jgi:LmbE family N-acetylglucosaminyl deacetylase